MVYQTAQSHPDQMAMNRDLRKLAWASLDVSLHPGHIKQVKQEQQRFWWAAGSQQLPVHSTQQPTAHTTTDLRSATPRLKAHGNTMHPRGNTPPKYNARAQEHIALE